MVGKLAYKRKSMQTKKGKVFFLLTVSFGEGSKFLINRVSLILQWLSHRPFAKISKFQVMTS